MFMPCIHLSYKKCDKEYEMTKNISIGGIYLEFVVKPEKLIPGTRLKGQNASEIIKRGLDLLMENEIKFTKSVRENISEKNGEKNGEKEKQNNSE